MARTVLKKSPIWTIGYDNNGDGHRASTGFIRLAQSGVVKDQCLLECSKWDTKELAESALKRIDNGEFFVYSVNESEDGTDRLLIRILKEK